ncbi:MAG: DUF5675 family protein [Deltaproteobacteria bacterium]|nr:DUF5675 family protein [Deltaproteobacteria bacterium]
MELILKRVCDDHQSTSGYLYIDGTIFCATLEDGFRHEKIKGITRIPAGRYRLDLRKGSPMSLKYQSRYQTNGMLWLKDVPGFQFVYIHIGNTDEDSRGCILVGSLIQQNISKGSLSQKVLGSAMVYKDLWSTLAPLIEDGSEVFITILDNG